MQNLYNITFINNMGSTNMYYICIYNIILSYSVSKDYLCNPVFGEH